MRKLFLLTSVMSALSLCKPLVAQQIEDPLVDRSHHSLSKAVALYDKVVGRNTMLYSGTSYYAPYNNIKGHQFFGEDFWELGSVIYDDETYDSIYLKYDIYRDQVLIENFNSDGFLSPIILFQAKVNSFKLINYHFIKIEEDTTSGLRAGYYNLMYQGDVLEFIVKRRKEIVDSNEISSVREEFSQKDRYYIKKDDTFHKVRRKRSLLKVLKDHKKEVKTFMKRNAIQFQIDPDIQIAKVVQYYDTLP